MARTTRPITLLQLEVLQYLSWPRAVMSERGYYWRRWVVRTNRSDPETEFTVPKKTVDSLIRRRLVKLASRSKRFGRTYRLTNLGLRTMDNQLVREGID